MCFSLVGDAPLIKQNAFATAYFLCFSHISFLIRNTSANAYLQFLQHIVNDDQRLQVFFWQLQQLCCFEIVIVCVYLYLNSGGFLGTTNGQPAVPIVVFTKKFLKGKRLCLFQENVVFNSAITQNRSENTTIYHGKLVVVF